MVLSHVQQFTTIFIYRKLNQMRKEQNRERVNNLFGLRGQIHYILHMSEQGAGNIEPLFWIILFNLREKRIGQTTKAVIYIQQTLAPSQKQHTDERWRNLYR